MTYVLKTELKESLPSELRFVAQKTMYGGKLVAAGDILYLFASETTGGCGLVARGRGTSSTPTPKLPGIARQTPRVSITVAVTARSRQPLGRSELKEYREWSGATPQAELNFKLYRQATNKIVGVTPATACFLETFFA